MTKITDVVVVDWDFSTGRTCKVCGEEPEDYWQMAKVRIRFPGIIPFTEALLDSKRGEWICLECLGRTVCNMCRTEWKV